MLDRGIIKWQPFNSCFDSKQIIEDISSKRQKINLPILSDDQINIIEEKIINAYNLKVNIKILFFYEGNIKEIKGKINYLDYNKKEIYINKIKIYFKQIVKIKELNFI